MVWLVHRGLGVRDFSLAAARALRRAVPFDGVCVLTIDPATLLPTSEVVENGLPAAAMARLTEIEIREPDYNKFDALTRAARPAASLSEATRGRLDQSRRQRELRRPSGFEDELRVVLISDSEAWGALTLLRERGRRHFTQAEVRRVTSLTSTLAEGLRRALLLGELSVSDEIAVGLILLADENSIEQASPAARELLEELGPEGAGREHVLIVIQAVASGARSTAAGETRDDPRQPLSVEPQHPASLMRPATMVRSCHPSTPGLGRRTTPRPVARQPGPQTQSEDNSRRSRSDRSHIARAQIVGGPAESGDEGVEDHVDLCSGGVRVG